MFTKLIKILTPDSIYIHQTKKAQTALPFTKLREYSEYISIQIAVIAVFLLCLHDYIGRIYGFLGSVEWEQMKDRKQHGYRGKFIG